MPIERQPARSHLLRSALLANSLFSGLSGAVLAVGSPALDDWTGINHWPLSIVGLGLVAYAVLLLVAVGRARPLRTVGRLAVAADLIWVAAAAAVIELGAVLTQQGNVALALATAVVLALAGAQWLGLRRLSADPSEAVR